MNKDVYILTYAGPLGRIFGVYYKRTEEIWYSLQQHEKNRRKQLFQATLTLCRLLLVNDHTSQPYIRVDRQYVLSR